MPFVSVVIPLYNKESYIDETILSVLNQTFGDFELIIVDDGSTDNSVKNAAEFNDERIKIYKQQNSGVSTARNNGILHSQTDWIAFLDADDWWHRTFLEELINLIKLFPGNEIFATGRCRVFKNKIDEYQNEFLPPKNQFCQIDYFQVISKYFPPINSSNVLIKKDALVNAGLFNVAQRSYEDHDMWLRLCVKREIVFVNKILSFYRKTDINTASRRYYKPEDFLIYLTTIQNTKEQLGALQKANFAKYYNRFALIILAQNYFKYTRKEKSAVIKKLKQILGAKYKAVLMVLHLIWHIKKAVSFT